MALLSSPVRLSEYSGSRLCWRCDLIIVSAVLIRSILREQFEQELTDIRYLGYLYILTRIMDGVD